MIIVVVGVSGDALHRIPQFNMDSRQYQNPTDASVAIEGGTHQVLIIIQFNNWWISSARPSTFTITTRTKYVYTCNLDVKHKGNVCVNLQCINL